VHGAGATLHARILENSPDETDRARWRFDEAFAALAEALQRLDVL
jgi:hypothetical protein